MKQYKSNDDQPNAAKKELICHANAARYCGYSFTLTSILNGHCEFNRTGFTSNVKFSSQGGTTMSIELQKLPLSLASSGSLITHSHVMEILKKLKCPGLFYDTSWRSISTIILKV